MTDGVTEDGIETVNAQLSVVVPSVNGWSDIDACLTALGAERADVLLDVIVPERCGSDVREKITRKFPFAHVLPVDVSVTIPEMRAVAFRHALAPTVAVIEDHIIVHRGWSGKMLTARNGEVRVVGGSVYNAATLTLIDRAAFLCEYGHVTAHFVRGPADWLVGNNTAYERTLLHQYESVLSAGRWENALHEAMRADGITLWAQPDISAAHKKHYTFGEYASQRFLYSRAFAADRLCNSGALKRALYGVAAIALPAVLIVRLARQSARTSAAVREFITSLPLLACFVVAWAGGEIAGAWFGDGGAMARVK